MTRLCILPVLGLMVLLAMGCDQDDEALPTSSTTATQTATATASVAPTVAATIQPTPQLGWEAYIDPGASYSLHYPDYLDPEYRSSGGISSTRFNDGDPSNLGFVISVQDAAGLSLEDWFAAYNACLPDTSPKARQIAGEQVLTCTASVLDDILEETAAIEHKGKIIYLSSTLTTDEFERVLSSLELDKS